MSDPVTPASNPYAVALAALEEETRVPLEDQVTEVSDAAVGGSAWAGDEQRRQWQLAGGA